MEANTTQTNGTTPSATTEAEALELMMLVLARQRSQLDPRPMAWLTERFVRRLAIAILLGE